MNTNVDLRPRTVAVIGLTALTLGIVVGLLNLWPAFMPATPARHVGTALVGGPFHLISHTGEAVSDRDFRGRPMVVAFGFTSEPDLTPATVQLLSASLDRLGAKADRVAVLFITLDPEHDTPPKLKQYIANFHPRLIALTGASSEIAAVAKAYGLPVERTVDPVTPARTTLVYEPLIYLMNRQGEYVTHLSQDLTVDALLKALAQVL